MTDDFRPRNRALDDEAIQWLVRMGGQPSVAERDAFAAWCARSPAHAEALRQARVLLDDVGRTAVASEHRQWVRALSPAPQRRRFSRRALLAGGASTAVAASLAGIAATGWLGPPAGLMADAATAIGRRRQVALPDGSQAWLNTSSALSIAYTDAVREVSVAAGEVLFDVVADTRRPARGFVARCGDGEIHAVTARCALRSQGRYSTLTVLEGEVEVRNDRAATTVRRDQSLTFSRDVLGLVQVVDAAALTAWTRNKLIFNRQPLATIAAELERYIASRVVVIGEPLRRLQLSGVFELDDTDALLRSVADLAQAEIVRLPLLILIR